MDEKSSDIKKTNRKIKNAMWAGIVSAAISVIFALTGSYGYDLWVLPDVAVILGLTFGIYKKNRACAVIMFIYWIGTKLVDLFSWQVALIGWAYAGWAFGAALMGYWFFQGILGTFAHHKIIKIQ